MFWDNWFKSKDTLKSEILEELAEEQRRKEAEEEAIRRAAEERAQELAELEQKAREEADKALRESDEPWVQWVGIVEDPVHGIKIELDWNDAFVKYLKENGYTGVDDDQIIQRYIAVISKDLATRMSEQNNEQSEFD